MAKLVALAVLDSAIQSFSRPMFVPTVAVATRHFSDEVMRKSDDNPMHKHPGDFALYELGSFTEEDGRFESLDVPRLVLRADSLVDKAKPA